MNHIFYHALQCFHIALIFTDLIYEISEVWTCIKPSPKSSNYRTIFNQKKCPLQHPIFKLYIFSISNFT